MLLVLDLGNSRFKWALATDPASVRGEACAYGEDFPATLDQRLGRLAAPTRAAFVTVAAPERAVQLGQWLRVRWGIGVRQVVASPAACGVANSYEQPERLGADRWAALIAARDRVAGAVCVVDAGTAVTIDALDAQGVFRGGVILPGLALQRAALRQGTYAAGTEPADAADCLARTTAAAVAAGTLYGLAGAIDRILDEQTRALGVAPVPLVTGGDAARLLPLLRHTGQHVPDLVLEGVARLATAEVAA